MVYLIHFAEPIGNRANRRAQAQHYIGYTDDLEARIAAHREGQGAAIMAGCKRAGVDWAVVRTWEGDRELERRLKRWHKARQLCPECRG